MTCASKPYKVFRLICFCPVVGGFQPQDQVMPSAGGHEEPSPGAGFGQSGQSYYNSRAVPRGGPRNPRGMMNGYRGSSNGFRGTSIKLVPYRDIIVKWPHDSL